MTRRHLQQYPTPEGVKLLRAAVQHARQITQKISEDKWLQWCTNFNAHTNLRELWRKLRIATGKLPRVPACPQPLQEENPCFATKLITRARESDIKNGLLRALNLNSDVFNKKTWLLNAAHQHREVPVSSLQHSTNWDKKG
ncbi:putative pol-like 34 [Homarus americanus]|uniref:Putative pol-like 34 n=1 Tax=Homarus americanus TaxID=6706 RepID=A0A8J5MUW1_HOMAM|nr:putative pol-like 34 [Homarus americanus]